MNSLRDLLWTINSPSLLDSSPRLPLLDAGRVDAEHLAAIVSELPDHRVGRYFELLVLYWLAHVRKFDITAHSHQIRDGNRTVGEIDFVFRDNDGRLNHWEVAVKFYLHIAELNPTGSHFVGPNAGDTFERKTTRMFDHQLRLSETHFPDVVVRRAFVKGRMFYHPDQSLPDCWPNRLDENHLRGTWIRCSQLNLLSRDPGMRFRILRKPGWLANEMGEAADPDLYSVTQLVDELNQHFAKNQYPVLISELRERGSGLLESSRIFVVSDDWPNANSNH